MPGSAAWHYHERTKHTRASVRGGGRVDWSRRPQPFKEYGDIAPVSLPAEVPQHGVPALEALGPGREAPTTPLTLAELSRLLRLGAGVLRTRRVEPGDVYHFRTYSSAGGLYPLELYVACARLSSLDAGLYHFHPLELSLRRLLGADVRDRLAKLADAPRLRGAGAVLAVTGILRRGTWRYGQRAYRHLYWDAGTMLAGLVALARSARLDAHVATGFADAELSDVLGVDGADEAPLALLAVGRAPAAGAAGRAAGLARATPSSVSADEAMRLHQASALTSADAVRSWRAAATATPAEVAPVRAERLSADPLDRVIARRGSARAFSSASIGADELHAILLRASGHIDADVGGLIEIRLIANAVEGIEPGAYRFANGRLELLGHGRFRRVAGHLCLDQGLATRAAATHFLLADLTRVLERLGDRGYRTVQLEAGMRAGLMYLAAYARCLGASALTFYDDEVTTFLAPGLSPMLTVAIGFDARRRDLARCREALVGRETTG